LEEKKAIKKIFGLFEQDFEFQKRIFREIKILKHFDHENV
jgi:serine/threonine protein kinase